MVYIQSWHEYQQAAEQLYNASPDNTRYVVKWKGSEGKLVLKITDNVQCIKFKTHTSIYLNRFEALNLSLIQKMQNKSPSDTNETSEKPAVKAEEPTPSIPITSGSTPTGGGTKKKKGKKKK